MAPKQLRGNQCRECKKTHEECADENVCERSAISLHVCKMFGTRPLSRRVIKQRRQT